MEFKRLILSLFIGGIIFAATAQDIDIHRFYGGVRLGFTASQISGDDLSGFNKPGFSGGLFVNHAITQTGKLKLQAELNFTMKGSHSKSKSPAFYALNLYYVEVPLLVEWSVGNWTLWGRPFRFTLEAGPMFGVNIYQKEREINGVIVGRPQFNRFEFSGLAGISLAISEKHGIGLRYSNSILPVRVPTWAYNRLINKQFNSVLTISYSYQF